MKIAVHISIDARSYKSFKKLLHIIPKTVKIT